MSRIPLSRAGRLLARTLTLALGVGATAAASTAFAQPSPSQKIDEEYTRLIRQHLTDPRISTELVDYLPASDVVPTPLSFPGIGRVIGTPGYLTKARDIHRYLEAIAKAAPTRAKFWVIGQSEEGRDMVAFVVSDEETIANLDQYKAYMHELADPRKTSEARARELIETKAKPIYYLTSGIHSTETGGPEMLMELAYRLVVDESPKIASIRKNVITMITPVIEPDGREKILDGICYRVRTGQPLPTPYWGKYVAHDNNRDGMGQFLKLTQHVRNTNLAWRPVVMHDLHEQATLLYVSTGTGPYNEQVDPVTVNEWWWMAENEVMEMTKRGVPGVWTYGFYDGWVPNYMFFMMHTVNAIGRFYEVQSYGGGCDGQVAGTRGGAAPPGPTRSAEAELTRVLGGSNYNQSREWFRPNPTPNDIRWGPRANTNIQQSAVLLSLWNMGKERDRFLENYWIKNKNAINRGTLGPTKGWVIPASQQHKQNAADAVNDLMAQGLEFHVADADLMLDSVAVRKGDWIIRGDQPLRTIADMYFAVQNYPTTNPSPYDDTGWTFPMMRNIVVREVKDAKLLTAPMTATTSPVTAAGGLTGTGSTIIVAHTGDNNLVRLRFRLADVAMRAAQDSFTAGGQAFGPGAFIIRNANRGRIEPMLRELGLSGLAVNGLPAVATHELEVPRIGYIHSWTNTQDEGWVRAALDHYGVPYSYFGENEVRKIASLRQRFDVILWPHGGAVGQGAPTGGTPVPYKRTAEYPDIGFPDSTDDTRGGLGPDGLEKLYQFVQQGGTLITEGNTSAVFPTYSLTPGLRTTTAPGLVNRGTLLRGVIGDMKSPIVYGYAVNQLPIYFSGGTLLDAGAPTMPEAKPVSEIDVFRPGSSAALSGAAAGGGGIGPAARRSSVYQNTTPMATWVEKSRWNPTQQWPTNAIATVPKDAPMGGRFGAAAGAAPMVTLPGMQPRVVVQFPASPRDMLLSGVLEGGEHLSNRPTVMSQQLGQGHVVLFTTRPFWRWQTQGTFMMGFNAILHWNDLGAGQ
jgi:hypothetical protein